MKKKLIISILIVALFVLISGCTEEIKDADNDGYEDDIDKFPQDPNEWNDTDNDGYGDNSDAFPNDQSEWEDTDNDGYGDNTDQFPYDGELHLRIKIADAYTESIPDANWGGNVQWNTTSADKYISIISRNPEKYINNAWEAAEDEKIVIHISNPVLKTECNEGILDLRITVDSQNIGPWRMWLSNNRNDDKAARAWFEIYRFQ